jgi:signal transduction histidine kinase
MATATKTRPRPVKPAAAKTKPPEPGALDYLQRALEDLNRARVHAQKDAQDGIDDATERIRAAAEDLRKRLRDEADELQTRLDTASDEARIELGRVAIRAQRTPEALAELAREVRRQKESLKDEPA